jgi:hypothetical protein
MNKNLLLAVLALVSCLPAQAGLYDYTANFALQPNSGNNYSASPVISGEASSIVSVILTLDFSSSAALNGSGIQGRLYLGTSQTPPYTSFAPNNPVYNPNNGNPFFSCSLTFDQSSVFYTQNPNTSWTLNLWDTDPTFGNSLVGWSLNISAVPEPVTVALALFGLIALAAQIISWRRKRLQARI